MAVDPVFKIKLQLHCGDEIAMGPGKADLLDAIKAHGSISAAARAMGMSYRRAWLLVDVMNRCWRDPLVTTEPGNAHGGASVSPFGERILAHYRGMQGALDRASDGSDRLALAEARLKRPRPSGGKSGRP